MKSRKSLSPIGGLLRRMRAAETLSEQTGMPADEALDIVNEGSKLVAGKASDDSRRRFLKQLGLGAAAIGVGAAGAAGSQKASAAPNGSGNETNNGGGNDAGRVAIVGAGVGGLRCAHRLQKFGIASTVFEGNTRIGGRVRTQRDHFGPGSISERGGELISTEHSYARNLVSELGLDLEDVNGNAVPGGNELYYVNGQQYTEHELNAEWRDVYRIFKQTQQDAPWVPTYDNHNALHRDLDYIDCNSWLDQVGIGQNSNMGQVFQADLVAEYGLMPEEMTALNLIYLLAWNPINSALPLAGTDERFRIAGGNDQLITRMLDDLPAGTVETGRKLVAIDGDINGPYTLTFEDGYVHGCDKLVLAIPFSMLRDVDIAPALYESFRPEKRMAIEQMTMGSNGKMIMEFNARPWTEPQYLNGEMYTPNGVVYVGRPELFDTWDPTSITGTTHGQLTNFFGGNYGKTVGNDQPFANPSQDDLNHFFGIVDNAFPGTSNAFTGRAIMNKWWANPWSKGAYSGPTFGDHTSWWGAQGLQEGNIHFCGEHTEVEVYGYIDGAISTAERAATAIHQA
ncbi:flavin monoamine oxidase family protein [Biformimicrobium ophioploci]|uniref:Tryptophan 2-monooxygenase n=1 Tax=Biformimicrobium ophioploci TaxID=3036711 RepID=A0ABQ6LUM3_9GAMM|nr:NAD(P)/FAD-dependent oxidoreductase [Microbulbifer sp. NKW57]GMG85787.1 hypothetical protein MNKW57_01080 [Microbulbifer sp. NKW57]